LPSRYDQKNANGGWKATPIQREDPSMGALEDVRKWLKEIPLWQELSKVPERVTALEKRMTELEAQLKPAPGERCDGCGELGLRLQSSRIVGEAANKYTKLKWKCQKCGLSIEEVE
jgi:hypothetical protein